MTILSPLWKIPEHPSKAACHRSKKSAQLRVDITGKNLSGLRPDLPTIPFQMSADVELASEQLLIDSLSAKMDKSDLSGRIDLRTGKRTSINVDLYSKLLDLSPFIPLEEETPPAKSDTAPPPPEKSTDSEQQYVFVDQPLPFDQIKKTDADVSVKIDRLRNHDAELKDLVIDGQLHDQDLNFSMDVAATNGGRAASDIHLNTAGKSATLDAKIRASNLQLSKDTDGEGSDRASPVTDITLDIETKGNTPRTMAASSDGRILLTQGPGQVENAMLSKFSGDILAQLFSALNPFSADEKYTRWDCTVLSMDIVNGESTINGMLLQGEKIMVVGGGDIDLGTEELKVTFNTKPRKGIGISADMFVTPFVQLGGTLAKPKIELNTKGAVVTTGAAFATMGISLLVTAAAERASAEGDKCESTLAELPPHDPLD